MEGIELSALSAYALCTRLASVWIVISAAEGLATIHEFRRHGVYDPRIILGADLKSSALKAATGSAGLAAAILTARLSAGLVLLLGPATLPVMTIGWAVTAATNLFSRWRRGFGDDGSDQMLTIMSVAFSASLLLGFAPGVHELGLLFIGAQSCLAYGASGAAKLISPIWRNGVAIEGIFSTRTYGQARVGVLVQRSHKLSLALSWGTILFETSFLIAAILPFPALAGLLVVAFTFHVGSAIVMGLNGFLWAFVATFPAIVFLNQSVAAALGIR